MSGFDVFGFARDLIALLDGVLADPWDTERIVITRARLQSYVDEHDVEPLEVES